MADPITAPATEEVFKVSVDNPQLPAEKTPEEQQKIKLLDSYAAMVNDESPQWYALKGAKGSAAKERFRPVNLFPKWSGVKLNETPEEVPCFAVERRNPEGPFHCKCADFVSKFEKSDAPPSLKK